MKIYLFKQYHLEPEIIWSSKKDWPNENYKWLLRIRTGFRNYTLDITKPN